MTLAESLVTDEMQTRGYAIGEFDQPPADLSVTSPLSVENYRRAQEIASRPEVGKASSAELRQAMVPYRRFFPELLDEHPAQRRGA